jgi:hypothetical protein
MPATSFWTRFTEIERFRGEVAVILSSFIAEQNSACKDTHRGEIS